MLPSAHTMAKVLSAAGVNTLATNDVKKINWRQDLAKKLLDLHNTDAS